MHAVGACIHTNNDKSKQRCVVETFDKPSYVLDKPSEAKININLFIH